MDYSFSKPSMGNADNYNDLSGLQSIKNEQSQDVALKKVAKQFESLFMHELLKNMRKANQAFEEGGLFQSNESNMFRDMYDQQLSLEMSSGKGLGIADVLYKQLSNRYTPKAPLGDHKEVSFAAPKRGSSDFALTPKPKADSQAGVNHTVEKVLPKDMFSSPQEFVEKLLPAAKKIAKSLAVSPFILVAQAALETGWGKNILKNNKGEPSNNLFNIKVGGSWAGEVASIDALEYKDGVAVKERSAFRSYATLEHSFEDFLSFLTENPRYQDALKKGSNEQDFIQSLQDAGYATDPNYSQKVLRVYQKIVSDFGAAESRSAD